MNALLGYNRWNYHSRVFFVAVLVPSLSSSGWAGNMCVYMGISSYKLHIKRERWAEDDIPRMKMVDENATRLCFIEITKTGWIPFWLGWTGSAQTSHADLNSPLCLYHALLWCCEDTLLISCLFFPQFSFCLLHLSYFSAFTPDTFSPDLWPCALTFFRIFSFSICLQSQPSYLLFFRFF